VIARERFAKNANQFFVRHTTATAMSLLPLRTFNAMENAMYFHLTNTQVIIGGISLALISIFALAAFFDIRRRTAAPRCDFGSSHKPTSLRQSSGSDDKDGSSNLYMRYADLSVRGLGTAEQCITFRGEKQQNLAGD
jgi:hypothetical protein